MQLSSDSLSAGPDISFVMPCYNEEEIVGYTVRRLLASFERAGYRLDLIAVDNGSADRTGEIIRQLQEENPSVIYHRVERNEGYGNGVLAGLPLCHAPWIGIVPADGQVDAEDVVRLYESIAGARGRVMAKVRRRFRMDGARRKVISIAYNLFVRLLWPRLSSLDINGLPKILPRDVVEDMHLVSRQWFLDPEIMIKAHYMGVRILELSVFARMRGGGLSHVRASTCWEFFRNLLTFRFSRRMQRWRQEIALRPLEGEHPSVDLRSVSGSMPQ